MEKIKVELAGRPAADIECDSWKVKGKWFCAYEGRKVIAMIKEELIEAVYRV